MYTLFRTGWAEFALEEGADSTYSKVRITQLAEREREKDYNDKSKVRITVIRMYSG